MNYERRLRAIGRLIDKAEMQHICVMEGHQGITVSGHVRLDTRVGMAGCTPRSITLSEQLVERTAADLDGGRGWFRRD